MIEQYLENQFRNSLPSVASRIPWWIKRDQQDDRLHLYAVYESCLENKLGGPGGLESFPGIYTKTTQDHGPIVFIEEKKYFPYRVVFVIGNEHPFILSPEHEVKTQ